MLRELGLAQQSAHVPCVQGAIGTDDKKSTLETGRKPMDKSCRVYGNFHSDNRTVKRGTPGLYRSKCQGKDVKTRLSGV